MALVRCEGCQRHIRDAECPFCGHAQELKVAPSPSGPRAHLARAAVLGVALGVSSVTFPGCESSAPLYGGFPLPDMGTDAGGDASTVVDAGLDATPTVDMFPSIDAAYGGPPMDLGTDAAEASDSGTQDMGDDGGLIAAYGAPPMDDAG